MKRKLNTPKKPSPFDKRYYLVLRNIDNLQEHKILKLGRVRLFLYGVVLLLMPMLLSVVLGVFMVPYIKAHLRDKTPLYGQILQLSATTDSLRTQLGAHQAYIGTLQAIFVQNVNQLSSDSASESLIERAQALLVDSTSASLSADDYSDSYALGHLYAPVQGFVSRRFAPNQQHQGMDIVAPAGTTIHSVADGRVFMATWVPEDGYVLAVQHADNLISVYKHNQKLFKKMGDPVAAGEAIASIGSTGTSSTGVHLHFELWHKSTPINPAEFIVFN